MASSSSQAVETVHGLGTITKMNDAVYEFHRPPTGFIDLDIVFFHGFQAQGSKDAYWRTWTLLDGSTCWLNTWLREEYPQSRIMSVAYDSSTEVTDSDGRMDMYLVGENLAQSIISLAGVGQSCPVVLVGHGVGGLVLKEVCCRAEQLAKQFKAKRAGINPYETFLRRMKGAVFFSTPHLGTLVHANPKRPSPLLKYYELLSADSVRLHSSFQDLRKPYRYGWKTSGIIEANITKNCETSIQNAMNELFGRELQNSPVVVEGSGRIDMDEFHVLQGKDSSTICRPEDRSSSNYQILLNFVQKILDEEWALKNWRYVLQFPQEFIKMPRRVQEVLQMLRLGEAEPSRVSLVGMGGIGKSTLAKELLVEIRSQFDFVCYVDDVKDKLKQQNLHTLVADNLYYGNGTKVWMQDVDTQSLWLNLKGKKVLLIMDNVDSEEQISILLRPNWVRKGSRLLVTSRQRTEQLMRTFLVHEVSFLSHNESMNLFLAHVDMEIVKGISKQIFHQIVTKCDGLPLTLEVIGSYLRCEKDPSIWEEALERLKKVESINGDDDDRLWAKLRVSFDRLAPPELRMFLDLAVFDKCELNSVQYDLDIWRSVWKTSINRSMVSTGLRNLVDKCLIRITRGLRVPIRQLSEQVGERELQDLALSSNAKFVYIHEQLRDMGRSIIRPYYEKIELCRGVWQSEDVDELLVKSKDENTHTEMLSVTGNHTVIPHFWKQYRWSSIGNLRQLRLLRMSNIGLTGNGAQRFPPHIVFFQMSTCYRRRARRPFHLLENDDWPIRREDVGVLHTLRVLFLENCSSVRFPENFHKLNNLTVLILREMELTKLPKKFGYLPSLQVLVLERLGLANLPDSFLQLSSLENLKISNCARLKVFPELSVPNSFLCAEDVLSPLHMLNRLTLENLPELRGLPETFGLLRSLEEVFIKRCFALIKLPESFGSCHQLKNLEIEGCASFESLGESCGKLRNLERLKIYECENLQSLPVSLGQIDSLNNVRILDCKSLEQLPEPFGPFRNLEHFEVMVSPNLQSLPECSSPVDSLKYLNLAYCDSLEQLPESIELLRNLENLDISVCKNLHSLPDCLGQLDSLKSINIGGCISLERLPESVGCLRNLEVLFLQGCINLQSLPESLGQLESLTYLDLDNCSNLQQLPESVGSLRKLEDFHMQGCESLESLPECLGNIDSLTYLDMAYCESLEQFPESLGLLRNLKHLDMRWCKNLQTLPECLGHMDSLTYLDIAYCGSLKRFPESVRMLRNLKHLDMRGCENLQSLPECLGHIDSLTLPWTT